MNFIIYEDEKDYATRYKKVINKLLMATNLNYEIIEISEYDETTENKLDSIDGIKTFLLDIEVPGKNGLELARNSRKNGKNWR